MKDNFFDNLEDYKENKKTKVMLFICVYFIYNGKEELFKFSKI